MLYYIIFGSAVLMYFCDKLFDQEVKWIAFTWSVLGRTALDFQTKGEKATIDMGGIECDSYENPDGGCNGFVISKFKHIRN